jgi:hypothetical protein
MTTSTKPASLARIPHGELSTAKYIYVFEFLAHSAAMEHVERDQKAVWKRSDFRAPSSWSQRERMLFRCYWSLASKALQNIERAKERGQLLLCWHGTKALGDEVYQ